MTNVTLDRWNFEGFGTWKNTREQSRCHRALPRAEKRIRFIFAWLRHGNPVSSGYRAGIDDGSTDRGATRRASRRRRGRISPSIRNRGCRCQLARSGLLISDAEKSRDGPRDTPSSLRRKPRLRLAVTFASLAAIHNRAILGDDRANGIAKIPSETPRHEFSSSGHESHTDSRDDAITVKPTAYAKLVSGTTNRSLTVSKWPPDVLDGDWTIRLLLESCRSLHTPGTRATRLCVELQILQEKPRMMPSFLILILY